MSLLSSEEKLDVLRMLAKSGGPPEVREVRNGVEILRKMSGAAMTIVKSHMGDSATSDNEATLAVAILQTRMKQGKRENLEFPEVIIAAGHKDQVTLWPRFEGLDLDDLGDLLQHDPRRRNPIFQLAIWCGVLRSLRALHRRGFLHCDVRPDNYCVSVDVRPAAVGFEVTPDFARVHAVDFGCSLVPPGGRPAQVLDFPFIKETAAYLSPAYGAARDVRRNRDDVTRALARLTPASDLWSVGYHIQQMLDKVPPDATVETAFGAHAEAALKLLCQLPARLGYPDGLPPEPTPIVAAEDDSLLVNVDLHDRLIEDIEKFTLDWECGPVLVTAWPDSTHPKDETGIIAPTPGHGPAPSPAPAPVHIPAWNAAALLAGVVLLAAGVAWKMWPSAAPPAQSATVTVAPPPPTMVDCQPPLRELDAVLKRSQIPDAAMQPRLRTALAACRYLIDRPHLIAKDDVRVAFLAAGYFALHLGQKEVAEQSAHELVQRYPAEHLGHFLTAKIRASEGNADATLKALTRAADLKPEAKLKWQDFDDERSQFGFLAGTPALARLEKRLPK